MDSIFGRRKEFMRFVLNFTGNDFYTYASDGTPIMIRAQKPGTKVPKPDEEDRWSFIVNPDLYEELKEQGRDTHDLAFLSDVLVGFKGLRMRQIFAYGDNARIMPLNCTQKLYAT